MRAPSCQRRFDALAELVVHGLLFAAPIDRAAQDRCLACVRPTRQLDLDALADLAPAARLGQLGGELAQLRLGRADDVAPPGLAQPRQVRALDMPRSAIHTRPTTPWRASMLSTMVCTVAVVGVAGEHLVAQREAIEGNHQADANLLAVGPVIASVAALRQRVGLRLAFEVGAGHIVQQHLVVDGEQLAAAPR